MSRRFALVENGIVRNVILAEKWPGGIDVTNLDPAPAPRWTYDGRRFAPPPAQAPKPEPTTTKMTHFAFLSRLTLAEHLAIEEAMPTSALLRVAKQRFDAAREVDVGIEETQMLVGLLVQSGLIKAERAAEILSHMPLSQRGAIHPETLEVTP